MASGPSQPTLADERANAHPDWKVTRVGIYTETRSHLEGSNKMGPGVYFVCRYQGEVYFLLAGDGRRAMYAHDEESFTADLAGADFKFTSYKDLSKKEALAKVIEDVKANEYWDNKTALAQEKPANLICRGAGGHYVRWTDTESGDESPNPLDFIGY